MHVVTIVVTLWNADMCVDSVSVQSVSSCKMKLSVAMFYFASGRNFQRCLHGRLLHTRFRSRLPSTTKLSQSTTRYCAAVLPAEQWRIRKFRKGGGRQLSAPSSLMQMRTTKIYAYYTEKAAF